MDQQPTRRERPWLHSRGRKLVSGSSGHPVTSPPRTAAAAYWLLLRVQKRRIAADSSVCVYACFPCPTFRSKIAPSMYSRSGEYDVCMYSSMGVGLGAAAIYRYFIFSLEAGSPGYVIRIPSTCAQGVNLCGLALVSLIISRTSIPRARSASPTSDL